MKEYIHPRQKNYWGDLIDLICCGAQTHKLKLKSKTRKKARRHWKKVARQKFKIEIRKEINEYN
jgi:hypothetical protein